MLILSEKEITPTTVLVFLIRSLHPLLQLLFVIKKHVQISPICSDDAYFRLEFFIPELIFYLEYMIESSGQFFFHLFIFQFLYLSFRLFI